ncbi:hypothetical protein [Rhizobium sp. CNPSo 3464]|uniref:hypothetical protein n=2 Tax=Rhizobium TaxID=379 RepID=UPI002549DD86|nr:hypothetical protein [Rhizobium sp. CNPSo 3464]
MLSRAEAGIMLSRLRMDQSSPFRSLSPISCRDGMNSFWSALAVVSVLAISAHAQALRPNPAPNRLNDCTDVVEDVLSKTRGRLLSFRQGDEKCTVIILLQKDGERPEKIILHIDRSQASADAE